MNLIEPQYIEKLKELDPTSDFEILLKQAIDLIQKLTGHEWTDFNAHDPGITILEQLCFALTDLHYKTEFDIEDILTDENGYINLSQHAFFEKEEILTCNPVTVNDFRKVILDEVEEVDNVMLTPLLSKQSNDYLKGLFKINIRVNGLQAEKFKTDPELKNTIKEKVRKLYLSKRNLCEDVVNNVIVLEREDIKIYANISIKQTASPEEVLVNIYNKVESLLNPKIKFYSEKELLDQGLSIEQIYSGPLLSNGFILDSELKPIDTEIDPIELTNVITELNDVIYTQDICINSENAESKPFKLQSNCFPYLDIKTFLKHVNLYSNDHRIQIKESLFFDLYQRSVQLNLKKREAYIPTRSGNLIKAGVFRNVKAYYSLQNSFPITYGLGPQGLSKFESIERKAIAKQLKTYLLFFEQVLANYLAQLANIGKLYSTDLSAGNQSSYHTQALYDVPGIQDLLKDYTPEETDLNSINNKKYENEKKWEDFKKNPNNNYIKTLKNAIETPKIYIERKNKIFDHLLARFNRKLNTYPIIQYFNTYIQGTKHDRESFILQWKAHILNNLIKIDQGKIKGFNYVSETKELSGFEYKLSLYLNINQTDYPYLTQFKTSDKETHVRRKLSWVFENGKTAFVAEKNENNLWPLQNEELRITEINEEKIQIITNSDEIIGLTNIGKLLAGGINQNHAYIFRNQNISVLKYGIHPENYKILPSINNNDEFIIIYKSPTEKKSSIEKEVLHAEEYTNDDNDEKWRIISRHPTKDLAVIALHHLIEYLKKLSIDSEGFHLIEHILLRPKIDQPNFGFRFYSNPNTIIFQNNEWISFDERDVLLAKIKEAAANNGIIANSDPVSFQLRNKSNADFTTVDTQIFNNKDSNENSLDVKTIKAELDKLEEDQTRKYPCIELMVKLSDKEIISEKFYSLEATIALPTWPARFQDKEFRTFVENMFRALAPSYLCLNFKWLGVSRMRKFEELYFNWLEVAKDITNDEDRIKTSLAITKWLLETDVEKQK